MFGAIERLFVDISTRIVKVIIDNKWLSSDRITHYNLHKEIDMQHAADFLLVVEDDWKHADRKIEIKQGILFGLEIFSNLYCGLYKNIEKQR